MSPRRSARWLDALAVALVVLSVATIGLANAERNAPVSLLNVSYNPTRELYQSLNEEFAARYGKTVGKRVRVKQAHGGSSHQARAVISGELEADVVTLGLYSDVDALRARGLIAADWSARLPNHSRPYYSTIVFVVRRGNPRGIHDWPDLVNPGVELITPDPKTSGNGKLSALAAWGAIVTRGGTEAEARAYLAAFFDHAPFLVPAARAAATAFAVEKLGDVHVSWENEALREVAEAKGDLEIVYPPTSILAEPFVAWVDANVARHGSEAAARAYLEFLFTEPAQDIIARNGYRPFDPKTLARHADRLPALELFPITRIAAGWADAQERFFGENGIIDTVYQPRPRTSP